MIGIVAAAALAAAHQAPADVILSDRLIRLRDVGRALPVGAALGHRRDIVIAALPRDSSSVVLTGAAIMSLVKKSLAGTALPPSYGRRVTAIRFVAPSERHTRSTLVYALTAQPAPTLAAGVPVVLRARVGPVVIDRPVTTLQAGRKGRRVFVRSADGQVFAARVDGASL